LNASPGSTDSRDANCTIQSLEVPTVALNQNEFSFLLAMNQPTTVDDDDLDAVSEELTNEMISKTHKPTRDFQNW
jgi:hypothetical protein